jgi:hypothetical protein
MGASVSSTLTFQMEFTAEILFPSIKITIKTKTARKFYVFDYTSILHVYMLILHTYFTCLHVRLHKYYTCLRVRLHTSILRVYVLDYTCILRVYVLDYAKRNG